MNRIKLALIAVLVAAGFVAIGVTACGGPSSYPPPATYTVAYTDPLTGLSTTYCPYEYDPYEIDMYGQFPGYQTCTRVAFPSLSIVPTGGLQIALMRQWTMYGDWYESGWYYDTYYAPIGPRYHVAVISRRSYMSNAATFDHTYASQIKSNSAKARWSNGKTGTYKFPTSNQKATTQTKTGTTNSRTTTNYGTDNSRSTTTGKTGSTRSGTSSGGGGTIRSGRK